MPPCSGGLRKRGRAALKKLKASRFPAYKVKTFSRKVLTFKEKSETLR